MANLTNSNKLIWKFAQIDSDISNIKESLPADWVGEWVITLWINDQWVGSFSVNQKNNEDINLVITRATVWLSNVNNTSDMDKPVSTAQQAALDLKADKSDTYTKVEVDDLLEWIVWIEVVKVNELPATWENWKIYLVPSAWQADTYDEYIWIASDSAFEKIWNTHIDLSNYYNKDEVDNLLDQKADASDIPTVNDWTLDIQLNWTSVETFSANSENNKTANIEVTKSTVWLWNVDNTSDADKPISTATQAALDLKADKTELPTVNDARITIQKNGESVDSFTLNQNTDNTINITVDKNDVWLWNVDNTSDINKPISAATQVALDWKQDTLTAWTWITIANNVISADWTWDVMYDDFKFVEMTGNTFENLSWYKTINANTNLLSWTNLKEWMQYVLFVTNSDSIAHVVTVDWVNQAEIPAGEQKMLVYLATASDSLQLQTCEWGWGWWQTPWNWTITVNQWGVEKWTFTVNQSTDTTIELDAVSEDAMEYPDFNFVDKTWTVITLDLNSTITATNNFTVNAPAEIKDWQIYVLRVDVWGNTEFTMTLWTNITNPYNVDISLWTNTLSQFVFLAVDGNLELQPQLMTRVDVENILREYNLIP